MINLTLTKEEAKIIFTALNNYRITRALSMMETHASYDITKDNTLRELDCLIEKLYYENLIKRRDNEKTD